MILPCTLVKRQHHMLTFISVFTSRPTFLLSSVKVCVILYGIYMVESNFFLICIVGGGVQTGSTWHVGHLYVYMYVCMYMVGKGLKRP
jgi:hypothetical protein